MSTPQVLSGTHKPPARLAQRTTTRPCPQISRPRPAMQALQDKSNSVPIPEKQHKNVLAKRTTSQPMQNSKPQSVDLICGLEQHEQENTKMMTNINNKRKRKAEPEDNMGNTSRRRRIAKAQTVIPSSIEAPTVAPIMKEQAPSPKSISTTLNQSANYNNSSNSCPKNDSLSIIQRLTLQRDYETWLFKAEIDEYQETIAFLELEKRFGL